jgi:hypothetical protein
MELLLLATTAHSMQSVFEGDAMQNHIKVVGILHVAWGMIGLSGAVITGAVLLLPVLFTHDRTATAFMAVFAVWMFLFMLIMFLPSLVGGIGLSKRCEWARILVLVLSFINLLAFPLGTALGIYSLWVLWGNERREYFVPTPPQGSS